MTLLCVIIQSVSPEFNALSKLGNSMSFGEKRITVVDMPEKSGILSNTEQSSMGRKPKFFGKSVISTRFLQPFKDNTRSLERPLRLGRLPKLLSSKRNSTKQGKLLPISLCTSSILLSSKIKLVKERKPCKEGSCKEHFNLLKDKRSSFSSRTMEGGTFFMAVPSA
ncbi:hypothetical protein C1H46_038324 [Malus baccata]|uniref:Uncharacterized protein n=1 Tax=Malus baccata TaxID=106549 RepID=A0A540KPJ1_MALBA|nr:hypothetical protein C1H46_038324 [Malus baccata]